MKFMDGMAYILTNVRLLELASYDGMEMEMNMATEVNILLSSFV
jgi:hypothetical protein